MDIKNKFTALREKAIKEQEDTKNAFKKHKKILMCIGLFILSGWTSGIVMQFFASIAFLPKKLQGMKSAIFRWDPFSNIYRTTTSGAGLVLFIIIAATIIYIYNYQIKPRMKKETGEKDTERNFEYSESGAYGTSKWISEDELSKVTEIKPIEETKGVILGYLEKDKVVSLPTEDEFAIKHKDTHVSDKINYMLNRHIAVCGAPGSMKSRAIVRPLIFQAVQRGESIIITDPKGEMAQDLYWYLISNGYDVKLFNLVDSNMYYSDAWNCLAEINGDETNAEIFAKTIIDNIGDDKIGYWQQNAQNLLKAVCLYVEGTPSIPTNMGSVYDMIATNTPDELEACFSVLSRNSAARRSYDIFAQCEAKVKGQILNNLGIYLSAFQSDIVRELTGNTEINLEKPALQKCAYFCITSDQHKTFDFIAVLFYAMLFIKLVGVARKEKSQRAKVPINFILDEFPNIGRIPDFEKKIAVVRSAGINCNVIFQNIAQMKNRYPDNLWEEILGCCDTFICLGNTDLTTQTFVSDKTGIASINVSTELNEYEETAPMLNKGTQVRHNTSVGRRNLMTPDEIGTMPNSDMLVFLRGQRPMKIKKYDYTQHPESEKICYFDISEHIPEWRKALYESGDKARIREIEKVLTRNQGQGPDKAKLLEELEAVKSASKNLTIKQPNVELEDEDLDFIPANELFNLERK